MLHLPLSLVNRPNQLSLLFQNVDVVFPKSLSDFGNIKQHILCQRLCILDSEISDYPSLMKEGTNRTWNQVIIQGLGYSKNYYIF